MVMREQNYGLFVLARNRLNQMLVYIRDDLEVCNQVPEIDIVLKDQMAFYTKPYGETNDAMTEIKKELKIALETNLDGTPNETIFVSNTPLLTYMKKNTIF